MHIISLRYDLRATFTSMRACQEDRCFSEPDDVFILLKQQLKITSVLQYAAQT